MLEILQTSFESQELQQADSTFMWEMAVSISTLVYSNSSFILIDQRERKEAWISASYGACWLWQDVFATVKWIRFGSVDCFHSLSAPCTWRHGTECVISRLKPSLLLLSVPLRGWSSSGNVWRLLTQFLLFELCVFVHAGVSQVVNKEVDHFVHWV